MLKLTVKRSASLSWVETLYAHPGESSAPITLNSLIQTSPDTPPRERGLSGLSGFKIPTIKNLT